MVTDLRIIDVGLKPVPEVGRGLTISVSVRERGGGEGERGFENMPW